MFPYALEYGMTAEEFWEADPMLFWSYRISFMNKIKEQQILQNQMMWIQGAYIYNAVSVALANSFSKNKKYDYLEKPFDFDKNTNENKQKAKEKITNQNNFWASFKHSVLNERE